MLKNVFFSALTSQLNVGLNNSGWQWCGFLFCTKHYDEKKIPSTVVDLNGHTEQGYCGSNLLKNN